MPMYNLVEYSDNYSKTSGCLWKFCTDGSNHNITECESFSNLRLKWQEKPAILVIQKMLK